MAIVITTNATGTIDPPDRRAMDYIIDQENARRAALTPPGIALPISTAAERKASYETCLNAIMVTAHASYVAQAGIDLADVRAIRQALPNATDAQLTAIKTTLGI